MLEMDQVIKYEALPQLEWTVSVQNVDLCRSDPLSQGNLWDMRVMMLPVHLHDYLQFLFLCLHTTWLASL